MNGGVGADVYYRHDCDITGGQNVDYHVERNENNRQKNDEYERLVLRHARAYNLMVDVILVRLEQGTAISQACQNDTEHVEAGNDEQRAYQHPVFAVKWRDIGVVHGELDEQKCQHVAQRQTAGIAHENLLLVTFAKEKIEIEIGYEHPHKSGNHDAINPKRLTDEAKQVAAQRNEREAGGQSVDSVNQVESVDNENDDKYRQQTTHHGR